MTDVLRSVLVGFDWVVLGYFFALNTVYLLLLIAAVSTTARNRSRPPDRLREDVFANPLTPGISVVMSAYNEEPGVVESARAALALRYPELEVIIVDDGSTDLTFQRLQDAFGLVETVPILDGDFATIGAVVSMHVPETGEPLVVVRKENAGCRADGLNAGLNAARHPLVCCVDADSLLEPDALLRVVQPFVDDPERVVAGGGVIRAVNGSTVYRGEVTEVRQPREWIARIQVIEYLRAFLLGRTGWARVGGLLIISGAFGLFRRDALVEVGGYDATSLGEDADVVAAIHRYNRDRGRDYAVAFLPDPVCWTEVPATRKVLGRQRRRWSTGLAQVLWKQRAMVGNPKYGRIGLVVFPYFLLFECIGPFIEVVGVAALLFGVAVGIVDTDVAVIFFLVAVLYGIVLSVASLLVEEVSFHRYDRWRDLAVGAAAAVLENVGYRQMHAWWRLRGLFGALHRSGGEWGEMTRAGFDLEEARP